MEDARTVANYALFLVALAHSLLTWPPAATAAVFLGGPLLAFPGEALMVRLGLLEHHTGPRIAGVPLPILAAWPAVVYVFLRLSVLLLGASPGAAALAAVAATAWDVAADPRGVREGLWSYPESPLSEPRLRGVPWWNFAGWLLLVGAVSALALVA
jgi:uncharacterized membrane protein